MILHTDALIGEILAFRLGKETKILLRTGWTAFDEEDRTDQPDGDLSYRPDFARIIAKEFVVMKKPVVIGLAVVVLAAVGPEATGGIKAARITA